VRKMTFEIDGQKYQSVGFENYENKFGKMVRLRVLEATCPVCGQPFRTKATERAVKQRHVTRRCKAHRSPGWRVRQRSEPKRGLR
jgi:hypothetical protein